jgi:hypothetical protein
MKNEPLKNPYKENGKWFMYDEAYHTCGPYETEEEAKYHLDRYCRTVLGPPYHSKGQWQFNEENVVIPRMLNNFLSEKCKKKGNSFYWKQTINKRDECSQFIGEDGRENGIKEIITFDFNYQNNNDQTLLTYERRIKK